MELQNKDIQYAVICTEVRSCPLSPKREIGFTGIAPVTPRFCKLQWFSQMSYPPSLGCVQTDATTPNIVAPTMLGVVACMLAVVCKRMQQLPTMLGCSASWEGYNP